MKGTRDEGYLAAAKAVLSQFYTDDLLTGCENLEEGIIIFNEMNELMEKGGFILQKWTSNSEKLLQKMRESEKKINHLQEGSRNERESRKD